MSDPRPGLPVEGLLPGDEQATLAAMIEMVQAMPEIVDVIGELDDLMAGRTRLVVLFSLYVLLHRIELDEVGRGVPAGMTGRIVSALAADFVAHRERELAS